MKALLLVVSVLLVTASAASADYYRLGLGRMRGKYPANNAFGFTNTGNLNIFGMTRHYSQSSLFSGNNHGTVIVGAPASRSRQTVNSGYRQLNTREIAELEGRMYAPAEGRGSGYHF